jgi:hypothetical protein
MKRSMLLAIALSVVALLSWWRASQGLVGWTEMSAVWSIIAIIAWVMHWRAHRKQGEGQPPAN